MLGFVWFVVCLFVGVFVKLQVFFCCGSHLKLQTPVTLISSVLLNTFQPQDMCWKIHPSLDCHGHRGYEQLQPSGEREVWRGAAAPVGAAGAGEVRVDLPPTKGGDVDGMGELVPSSLTWGSLQHLGVLLGVCCVSLGSFRAKTVIVAVASASWIKSDWDTLRFTG